jgi:hypothetical protein
MRPNLHRRAASEQGTVFIHVAIALFALFGIMAYVFDLGIVWVSRGQAQNAADAGALSGALARAFDDFDDPPVADGIADTSGRLAALANSVWSAAPGVNMSWNCPTGVVGRCARADVYRNGEFASASLPLIFGPVLGITNHGVRATATAVVSVANSTRCMRPFSVADRWLEVLGTDPDNYDHWVKDGSGYLELDPKDSYSPGTGWTIPEDIGQEQILKGGNNPNSDTDPVTPGWMLPVRLPDGAGGYISGADDYREAIWKCIGAKVSIGDLLPLENGVMVGPTDQGVQDLIDLDPDAFFNPMTKEIEDSCAPGVCPIVGAVAESPRIVPIAVWDTDEFNRRQATGEWGDCPIAGGQKCVRVVKILGYFITGMSGQDVVGILMTMPGDWDAGAGMPPGDSFLINIRLVR